MFNTSTFFTILNATQTSAVFPSGTGQSADNSVLVVFDLDAADQTGHTLRGFFDRILPDTQSHEGNLSAEYFTSQDDPAKLLLLEKWSSNEAFDSYLNWRIEQGDFAQLKKLLAKEPNVSRFLNR